MTLDLPQPRPPHTPHPPFRQDLLDQAQLLATQLQEASPSASASHPSPSRTARSQQWPASPAPPGLQPSPPQAPAALGSEDGSEDGSGGGASALSLGQADDYEPALPSR